MGFILLLEIREQSSNIKERIPPKPIKIRGSNTRRVKNKVQPTTKKTIKEIVSNPNSILSIFSKLFFTITEIDKICAKNNKKRMMKKYPKQEYFQ